MTGGACGRVGCGVVYKIDATGKESVLHSFVGNDGSSPQSGALTMDASGNLYGTVLGGTFSPYCMNTGCGVVFELDPAGKATVLHAFSGADGDSPGAGVVRDAMGNLYGTTQYGGANREGVAFKLSPTGNETILYTFDYPYGTTPHADLLPYRGYLYGTTFGGGTGAGTAFKLQP